MKTRHISYNDYGFAPGEEKQLKEHCRRKDFKTYIIVHLAAYKANPEIAEDLAYSLINGLSYEKMEFTHNIPIPKVDFYAYRRKCLFIFKRIIQNQ